MTNKIQGLGEDGNFSYDGYQVVRGEFLSRTNMPAICFNDARVSVNAACLRGMPDARYIQFLVNPSERKLALKPCGEYDRDSFIWCNDRDGKRIPRKIICRIFTDMLTELMDWETDKGHRIMGTVIKTNSEALILFDLNYYETLWHTSKSNACGIAASYSGFPEDRKDSFGLTMEEHEKSITENLFDDYTVFSPDEQGGSDGK